MPIPQPKCATPSGTAVESTTAAPSKPERSLVLFEGVSLAGGLLPDGLNHHCIKGIFFSLSHLPELLLDVFLASLGKGLDLLMTGLSFLSLILDVGLSFLIRHRPHLFGQILHLHLLPVEFL